jgi:hypothetical protein
MKPPARTSPHFRPAKKRAWSAPLADFVGALIDPVVAKQGFGESDLLLHWDDIAGARLAAVSEPLRLTWPPRGPKRAPDAPVEPATLVVRVATGYGLDLQHLAPILIERVNAHLGWRCIGRLKIEQGRLERRKKAPDRVAPPDPAAQARADAATAAGFEEPLRAALARLGARIYTGRR